VVPKLISESEAEKKRLKAVEFLERIGGDADKFRDMSASEYAAYKGAELLDNPPKRILTMTKNELSDTLDQLADGLESALDPELSREELISKIKELSDIASGESEENENLDDDQD